MRQIILNEKLTLAFEPLGNKLRLIIFDAGEELVCRKEKHKNLQHFLAEEQAHIFKGRLQLKKIGGIIEVLVKNKSIGVISSNSFEEVLDAFNN
ncbi:hypothetical protein [Pedobacter cryotolerans]|uniref:Uncharacterized protein n=1 Tax=Pedobacter cryotolerans TaxID=2571270 RepID=A0A4U1C9N8_9SPHI|nr:hypothetical protein [Pedobacter cryotolerans]TKC02538.1 hypothetical protein FA045_04480 [Pedobacter cryotolerans]